MLDNTGLYIHIPFCVRKCNYCDFCSVGIGDGDDDLTDRLVDCLIKELQCCSDIIKTVFIGGGTPSILPVDQMEKLLSEVINSIDNPSEFTIECNPGTVDSEKLKLYKSFGINRISFGLQSANNNELKTLGRIHTYEDFLHSYDLARKAGFDNINIDLMTAIPGQTAESLQHTLEEVISLTPEHISAYSLIIEEGTPFYESYHIHPPIDEETDRQLYDLTHELLTTAGYDHYEISNYAARNIFNSKSDNNRESINENNNAVFETKYACKHNLNYWRRGNYIGIGPAASSHINGVRHTNVTDIDDYISRLESDRLPYTEEENLSLDQQLIEAIYLGLRTSTGIDINNLSGDFGFDLTGSLPESKLSFWQREGLISFSGEKLTLTPKGFWLSDSIVNDILKHI